MCWVGNPPEGCVLALFVEASFAGYIRDSMPNTGAILCSMCPNTLVPMQQMCKKHTAVSHNSTEAEVIALDAGMRTHGIPTLLLWELAVQVLGSKNNSTLN